LVTGPEDAELPVVPATADDDEVDFGAPGALGAGSRGDDVPVTVLPLEDEGRPVLSAAGALGGGGRRRVGMGRANGHDQGRDEDGEQKRWAHRNSP